MRERIEDDAQRLFVIGHELMEDTLVLVGAVFDIGILAADALAEAFCKHRLRVGFDELVLQGRRTGIQYEDLHCLPYFLR